MIVERITGHVSGAPAGKRVDTVPFEWFEASGRLMRKTSSAGEEIGLRLREPLTDGGVLHEDGKRILALELVPCEIICVRAASMEDMGRICYEIGNRHLPVSIEGERVMTPYDAPAFERLEGLGFECVRFTGKFVADATVRARPHG